MKRLYPLAAVAFLAIALASPLRAQVGGEDCTDSPENPTVILGLVGVAGAGLAQLRYRMKKK